MPQSGLFRNGHKQSQRRFTTWRYEAPEAFEFGKVISQQYDIWSYGCVILEFIVWLLTGSGGLDHFNKRIVDHLRRDCHYFETRGDRVVVHSAVVDTMKSLSQRPECQAGETALGDLLSLVRSRLLVVAVNSSSLMEPEVQDGNRAHTNAQVRADSSILKRELGRIIERGYKKQDYWLKTRFEVPRTETNRQEGTKVQATPGDSPRISKPATGVDTDKSDKAPYPAQQNSTEVTSAIESVFDNKAQGLGVALIDSTPGANFSQSGGSRNTFAGEPPKRDDVHSATSSTEGRLDAENIPHEGLRTDEPLSARDAGTKPVQGTVQPQVAIDDIMRSESSAPPSHEFRNVMSSETGLHPSTDLTVPTTFGSIDQEIFKVDVGTEDADQYSAAGSAAPHVDQYVDIITTSLLLDVDPEDLLTVEGELPSLLKECAIRIGHENPSIFHREMMFFTHKYHT